MGNIKSVKYFGDCQTYDLEVDHKDHQFYMSNGMLTSNSHAIVYSMVSYKTAYLKAHYPIEFLLANLIFEVNSNSVDSKNKIERIKQEIRKYKVKIIPPSLNDSQLSYTINSKDSLLTGLDALKSIGTDAINDIIEKRPFKDFFDFMVRVDTKKTTSRSIQALAGVGCFDDFGLSRKSIILYCSDYRKKLTSWLKRHDPTTETMEYPWPEEKDWTVAEKYALEKHYLGEAFTSTKDKVYGDFFEGVFNDVSIVPNCQEGKRLPSIKAEIKSVFEFRVKKEDSKFYGQQMAKIVVEGIKGHQCGMTVFPDTWKKVKDHMKKLGGAKVPFDNGLAIHFGAVVNIYEDEIGLILDNFYNYKEAPTVPNDLKAKTVSLKREKNISKNDDKTKDIYDSDNLLEDIEDSLFDEGLIDFDDTEQD